ncbi:MAG: hypothetical protein Q8Q62_16315 [Mesorhizobium sp.]|nr:hypothetical protein [Mesorhizobium sp.]
MPARLKWGRIAVTEDSYAMDQNLSDTSGCFAPSADIKQCLARATALSNRFATGTPADQRTIRQRLLNTITLGSDAIAFTIKASELVTMLAGRPTAFASDSDDEQNFDPHRIIKLPVTIKRRGNEMRLAIHGEGQHSAPDPQLVSLLARAHLHLQHLTRAPGIRVSEVARDFGVHRVDVGRILPLAFLAPKVVEQILTGNQPDEMSARNLARADLPLLWSEQASALS